MVITTTPISCEKILSTNPQLFIAHVGDLSRSVHAVAAAESAGPGTIAFLANQKAFISGVSNQADVLVVSRKLQPEAEKIRGTRTILVATNVELAMAEVIRQFFLNTPYTNRNLLGIHPTAVIAEDAEISPNVRIGPHAFIGSKVKIGAGSYIGAGSVVEDLTQIGELSVIHPQVFIGHSCIIGNRCEIHPQTVIGKEGFGYAHDERGNHFRIPHQGTVVLEDDVHIGACCAIDRATFGETRISFGTKIDNLVHIAHNCRIGKNSLLTAGFAVAGSSQIGANFMTGGRATVTGHIKICDNVQLAGMSVVTKEISEPGPYGGYPLQPLPLALKTTASLIHISEMRKQISKILNHIGLSGKDDKEAEAAKGF